MRVPAHRGSRNLPCGNGGRFADSASVERLALRWAPFVGSFRRVACHPKLSLIRRGPPSRCALRRATFAWLANRSSAHVGKRSEGWAHQDSNLERAGYEPAALTIELWARQQVYPRFPYRRVLAQHMLLRACPLRFAGSRSFGSRQRRCRDCPTSSGACDA